MFEPHFIDILETQEAIGEYYDFSTTTDSQWQAIDRLTADICHQRHIPATNPSPEQYDTFCAILDGVCSKIGIKQQA